MIVPSIDIQSGEVVQLIGGKKKALSAGSPLPLAREFGIVGEIAVIDLDAAMNTGTNRELIQPLLAEAECRVGGGIRSVEQAVEWLNAGASKVIIGTKASPELLSSLPPERVLVALDAKHGEVVVDGWQTGTGKSLLAEIDSLKPYAGSFLVTFVEREGKMEGIDREQVKQVVEAASPRKVTIAGGVTSADEVAFLDAIGADAQVGMALYAGKLSLAEAFTAPLKSEREDGLWPTVVVDEQERALGLCWSNLESVTAALSKRSGIYWSRKRGLWVKGRSSGNTQELIRISIDCDRDALRFMVRQAGNGFCHLETYSCWGPTKGLKALESTLEKRRREAPVGSYSARLFADPDFLNSKLKEEAEELTEAQRKEEVVWEAADLLYFTLVKLRQADVSIVDVERALDLRARAVKHRHGETKPEKK